MNWSVSSFAKVPRIIDCERVVGRPNIEDRTSTLFLFERVPMTPARLSSDENLSSIRALTTSTAAAAESRRCWRVLEDGTER